MNDSLPNNHVLTVEEMERRYGCAQALMQGITSKAFVRNSTVVPHWIDNDCFWYVRETNEGKEYRRVDATVCSNQLAFDHAALASALSTASSCGVDANNLPISRVCLSLSPLRLTFDAFAQRWTYAEQENTCAAVEPIQDHELISPDGRWSAFVRDHNLWLREQSTGKERALTQDGEAHFSYASAPSSWGGENHNPRGGGNMVPELRAPVHAAA